jgi:hypothetical protein
MEILKGDWVRAESGVEGRVALVRGRTAFVELDADGKGGGLATYQLSQLVKIDQPTGTVDLN